jgi:hypothetical protein
MPSKQKRSRLFWATSPFLIAIMALLPVMFFIAPESQSDAPRIIALGAMEIFCTLLLLGLYDPFNFWWAWRCLAAMVFTAAVICVLGAFIESGGRFATDEHNGTTVFEALSGLVLIGMLLPGLAYAIFGRFTFRHVREQIPDNIIQPDDTSPEAIYVNLLMLRAVERKETIEINRSNLVSIPEENIDASSISFDKIIARCKELVSEGNNPLRVVFHKEKPQEANVQFVVAKDSIQISVST